MTSCKACGAPLDGPMSFVARLMGVKASQVAPGYCNKCEELALAKTRVGTVRFKAKKKTRKRKTKSSRKRSTKKKRTKRKSSKRKKTKKRKRSKKRKSTKRRSKKKKRTKKRRR